MVIIDKTNPKALKAQDLRVVVLALKMGEYKIVDEKVSDTIFDLVRELPSPEHINIMASGSGGKLLDLEKNVGYIFGLIDQHGSRDLDFKARYKARTGLNPMHKVLDYKRVEAQRETGMKKEAANFVRNIVKTSSSIDESGEAKLSSRLLSFASDVRNEKASFEDALNLSNDLRTAGFNSEADEFLREAGFWSGVGNVMKGVGQGVADKAQQAWEGAKDVGQGVKETYQVGNLQGTLKSINDQIAKAQQYAQQVAPNVSDPQKSQQINEVMQMLGNMGNVGQQISNLVDQDAQGQGGQQGQDAQGVDDMSGLKGQRIEWEDNGAVRKGIVWGRDAQGQILVSLDGTENSVTPLPAEYTVEDVKQQIARSNQATDILDGVTEGPSSNEVIDQISKSMPTGSLEQGKTPAGPSGGQAVSWTSGGGNVMSGSVVGPSKNPNETIITLQNGQQTSVSTQKLQMASLANFRIIEG